MVKVSRATMHVIGFILFGLLIGVLAHLLVAGGEAAGWIISMLCGAAGSLAGGFFGRLVGLYGDAEPAAFVTSLLGAFSVVAVYQALAVRRRARSLRNGTSLREARFPLGR